MGNQPPTPAPDDAEEVRRASALSPEQEALADDMAALLREQMERDYPQPGTTRRDGHPKALGVVRGTFTVDAELPGELAVGFFGANRGKSFDAVVRFSSASGTPQPDTARDLRGVAVKLFESNSPAKPTMELKPLNQSFLLLSCPTMPLGTVESFHTLVESRLRYGSMAVAAARLLARGELWRLIHIASYGVAPDSLLDLTWHSTTPYKFGDAAQVKYKLVPSPGNPRPAAPAGARGDDYLTDGLRNVLVDQGRALAFDFFVQLRKPHMSLNDAGLLWSEDESPPRKVGTLRVPAQELQPAEVSERLAVSPGQAFPENRPLGGINLARERIYQKLSAFRHERDGRPYL